MQQINQPELRTFVLDKDGEVEEAKFAMFSVHVTTVDGHTTYRYDGKEKSFLQLLMAALIRSDVIIIAINNPETLAQA
ncbi:MAG: hypothetical protein ACJ71W_21670 [Terriglobales bacterium]